MTTNKRQVCVPSFSVLLSFSLQSGGTKVEVPSLGTWQVAFTVIFSETTTGVLSSALVVKSVEGSTPKARLIAFWNACSSEVISGLLSSSSCCLALRRAAVNEGGSCSSSRSMVWNSSIVSWLDGVSRKSPNLFLMVVSLIRTVFTTSRTVLQKPCNLADTKRAGKSRKRRLVTN